MGPPGPPGEKGQSWQSWSPRVSRTTGSGRTSGKAHLCGTVTKGTRAGVHACVWGMIRCVMAGDLRVTDVSVTQDRGICIVKA